MAYALIPDSYTLEKVTKLQKQAVDAKRRHDNVEALLANPNTPLVLGGGALLAATPFLLDLLRKLLADSGVSVTDDVWITVKENWMLALGPAGLSTWLSEQLVGERRLSDLF